MTDEEFNKYNEDLCNEYVRGRKDGMQIGESKGAYEAQQRYEAQIADLETRLSKEWQTFENLVNDTSRIATDMEAEITELAQIIKELREENESLRKELKK